MSTPAKVRLLHASLQRTDTAAAFAGDANRLFARARMTRVFAVTGTEAPGDLADTIRKAGHASGFAVNATPAGEWAAVNLELAKLLDRGFAGPFIPGTHGLDAHHGAHTPRGVAWVRAEAKEAGVGVITVGSAHYLTARSVKVSGSNEPLTRGIGRWARDAGLGSRLVFLGADTNLDDARADVMRGQPLTTCWDELGKHPPTHAGGERTIDVVASYDADGRVHCLEARAMIDSRFALASDHYAVEATYAVRKLPGDH